MSEVIGITMVKNEEDILQYILDHLLTQDIDHIIVADNMSNDNTLLILESFNERFPGRFTILEDREPGYYQAQKMNSLMNKAVSQGADFILPFDADELWLAREADQTVGKVLRSCRAEVFVAEVWNMVGIPEVGNPLIDMSWRESRIKSLPSVAFKWESGCSLTQGNHDVLHSGRRDYTSLWVRHYQYRSLSQLKLKVRQGKEAYDATDLPEGEGFHWRNKGALSDDRIRLEWEEHISQSDLIYDPFIK